MRKGRKSSLAGGALVGFMLLGAVCAAPGSSPATRPDPASVPHAQPDRAPVRASPSRPPAGEAVRVIDGGRLDGEYGLWVRRQGDSLTVAWITRTAAEGFLQVYQGSRLRFQGTTPLDSAHTARFPDIRNGELLLRYGALADSLDRHATRIRSPAGPPRTSWSAPDSIVVLSDVHGEFDRLTRLLRNAGLINERLEWAGGRQHVVVLGDVLDRGADATRSLWFLYGLQPEAERSGGRLHLVLGNHEIMVMTGDLRYLAPKEVAIARLHGTTYDGLYDPRTSVLGRWLLDQPPLLRIGDVLFAHGGVSTDYIGWRIDDVRDTLAAYAREELFHRWMDTTYVVPLDSASFERRYSFFWSPRSIFWYREYAQADSLGAQLAAVLDRFDARIHVIGHTPNPTITASYGGRLIDVNTLPFVTEALLLVRRDRAWNRFRIREQGPPEPIASR